jgi:hypothetical protein
MAKLNEMCLRILGVIKAHPEGVTEGEIREILKIAPAEQSNFGRRRRELHATYLIGTKRDGARTLYVYLGVKERPLDTEPVNRALQYEARRRARDRCHVCGRTTVKHGIVLVVDHKLPRDWGGETVSENLEAICEDCNAGKKNFFSSVDSEWMRQVMSHKSVHMRLGETLKAFNGQPVAAATLELVADQDDWKKRVRELRYLGWDIRAFNKKMPGGRVSSFYQLNKSLKWPADPTGTIRQYERERAQRNRSAK